MKLDKKVLITQPIHPKGMAMLEEAVERVVVAPDYSIETIASLLDGETDGVIVRYNVFNRELMEKAPNLKVISRHGIGTELIDLAAATERGVMVVNTPSAATISVAEHVVMMVLMLSKRINAAQNLMRSGRYGDKDKYNPDDVEGKTIGFIGLGRIGSSAAERCVGLDMRAIAYDPYIPAEVAAGCGVELRDSIEEVLSESDFVSLHTPLTPTTRHMIGKDRLAMMKPTAYLINCSRGDVVDEAALIEALRGGVIAGAGLDVFEQEPPASDNPLLTMENVVLTPHSSSLTLNGKIKMATTAVEQLLKVLRGEQPDFLVNRDILPARIK